METTKILTPELVLGQFRSFAKGTTKPTGEVLRLFHKVAKAYRIQYSKDLDKGLKTLKTDILDMGKTKSWINYLTMIQKPKKEQK